MSIDKKILVVLVLTMATHRVIVVVVGFFLGGGGRGLTLLYKFYHSIQVSDLKKKIQVWKKRNFIFFINKHN